MTSDSLSPVQRKKKSNKTTCVSLYNITSVPLFATFLSFSFTSFSLSHTHSLVFSMVSPSRHISQHFAPFNHFALTAAGTTLT